MSVFLYPHGGSGNHGCEAIVRATAKILGNAEMNLFSMRPEQDHAVGLDDICTISKEREPIQSFSANYIAAYFQYHFLKRRNAFEELSLSPVLGRIKKEDILLSIGGDNYCYNVPVYIYIVNDVCRRRGIKTCLWGCSIEPSAIDGDMLKDLEGYTRIFARESITYEALVAKGLQHVSLFPDPAFVLSRKDVQLPESFVEGNTVGINVSPLIIGHEASEGMTLQNYIGLIQYILDHTDMQVALIPHVVWANNDDRQPLQKLYEQYKSTDRVVMIEDHPAEELKGIIARCRFMVAARTHASIAAYSSQVPTLVIGYSVKARGIARDIFGSEGHYVLPVQSLRQADDLTNGFCWLMAHEREIRAHYANMMPEYINRAMEAGSILMGL